MFDDTASFERQRGSFHQHAKMRPIREFHEVQRAAWRLVLIKHTGEKDGRRGQARAFRKRTPRPHIAVRHRQDRLDLTLPLRFESCLDQYPARVDGEGRVDRKEQGSRFRSFFFLKRD